jgi:hypothetical protein
MRAALPLTAALLLGACNMNAHARDDDNANHQNIRRDFQVGAFQKVALEGSHDVVVTVGGAPSVRAEGDKAAIDRLDIRVENGELKIGTRREQGGWSWNFGGSHHNHVTIYVTAPALAAAAVTGSGDMKIDKVAGNDFSASIGGSGDLDIGSVQAGQAHFSVTGSGDMKAAGKAQQASLSIAGSGGIVAGGLEIANATVSVVGSGDVTAHVTQTADVSVLGSGDVTLSGSAKCSIHKMGSGDVHCGG